MTCIIRALGQVPYDECWAAMKAFTEAREADTPDEVWWVEHPPVFTQGQAGKPEHLLLTGDIPVVQSDRGGQVTYHGPGQLVVYPLIDVRRRGLGVRDLVTGIETALVMMLKRFDIEAYARSDAPGVYVEQANTEAKIASLGLRIRHGCSFHGLALNVHMDLSPFLRINPCGYAGMPMTQMVDCLSADRSPPSVAEVADALLSALSHTLSLPLGETRTDWPTLVSPVDTIEERD